MRPRGEDLRVGDAVLAPGVALGPAEIGLLATLGIARCSCTGGRASRSSRRGTSSPSSGASRARDRSRTPTATHCSHRCSKRAATPTNLGIAADTLDAIEQRLQWGAGADVLLSSAGVSVGDLDLVKTALTRAGAELHLWQVSMRPGKPITFGSLGGHAVFGLPGNPVSAMVTFELFVRPALRRLAGFSALHRLRLRARALGPIDNPGRRRGYLRVTLERDGTTWGARLTGDQGSAILTSMVRADGLAVVTGDTTIPAGGDVEVIVFRDLAIQSV